MENVIQPEVQNSAPEQVQASEVNNAPVATNYNKPKLTPAFQMLESAIKLWWNNLDKILKLYWEGIKPTLIPFAVAAVLAILGFVVIKDGVISNILKIVAGIAGFIAMIFAIYFWTRAYIAVFVLVKKDYKDEPKETYQETKTMFWPYIWLSLLTALLIFCWMLLLIIPGIIFSVLYSLAIYAFFFEGKKGMAAIRRSRTLTKGYFWPIFGRIALFMFVTWCFMMVISAPVLGASGESILVQIWNAIIQIISWLVGPIALLFSYNIYADLVKIKK